MKQTIALQTPGRSDLDQSSLFSFDQFTAARPTAPVIHRDARFLLVRSGSGVIRLQGREYPLSAGSLAAILPWQISEIVRVDEQLACSVIAYHDGTVARAVVVLPVFFLPGHYFWSYRWQTTKWPGSISRCSGTSVLHCSMHWAQRVWNLQPAGGLAGEGMEPSSTMRFILAVGSGTGMAENRALV